MAGLASTAALRPSTLRAAPRIFRTAQGLRSIGSARVQAPPPRRRRFGRGTLLGLSVVAITAGVAATVYPVVFGKQEPIEIPKAEIEFEKKPPKPKKGKDDSAGLPNVQVKKSWEHPGVYAWGSNSGKVVAPESDESVIKTPRSIPYFDGQILRDLKLDSNFGAAVTENGDLVQWGAAFSKENSTPEVTLKGKDITKLAISKDRILALSSGGSLFSLPVSKADQEKGEKQSESSWLPFWSGPSSISYRLLKPGKLNMGERIIDISSGLEHALLLTSQGRVFSTASSSEDFPSKGQMGIPGLTWLTKPKGPFDQPHEISTLKGHQVKQIATGDYHSVVLDAQGQVFSFGDNSTGQLGFPVEATVPTIDTPSLLPLKSLYKGTGFVPTVTSIAAGGDNSFFSIDATKTADEDSSEKGSAPKDIGRVVADTWACGEGIYGSLGTGKWTHISDGPTKIKALSNLSEWNEKAQKVVPIRLSHLSVGSTHSAAVLGNASYLDPSGNSSDHDTNLGADVLLWGGNEHYQLGTGKRSNANTPTYIAPLDSEDPKGRRTGEEQRLQVTPRKAVRLGEGGKGRKVSVEQRVECGRYVSAVYSGA
ncbi:hypothetical protein NKR23_g4850 [Pleurostoma richardsiae]|uniref:Mitochondrial protein n=1 Tax=Pleurostoma richardsiae TaxID=41990 RepID=A0AA38RUF1_9PEZI|nr:hypothetical protein NKR23_g4850 [Pleurostoma richardsiae]